MPQLILRPYPGAHEAEHRADPADPNPVALTRQSRYLLGLLGQRYVQYYPVLSSLTGSIKAALMLGHALYWTRHWLADHPERDGWFWKKATEWQDATGLTVDEQMSARSVLTSMRLLQEQKRGMPATLTYRVNLYELGKQLSVRHSVQFNEWVWDNAAARTLLGRPVVFYKPLADVAGSVTAGLYLSHLLAAQRTALMRREVTRDGYFHHQIQRAQTCLVIGPKAQRNARARLKAIHVLAETWTSGLQPKLLSCVRLDELGKLLTARASNSSSKPSMQVIDLKRMADSAIPVSGKGQPLDGGTVHSRVALLPKQELPKARIKNQEKGNSIRGVNTLQNEIQPPPLEMGSAVTAPEPQCGGGNAGANAAQGKPLIFPSGIRELEHRAALRMIAPVQDDLKQPVLDEWAGQLSNPNKTIANRIGYLRCIIEAAKGGTFVPTVALAVADSRARQQAIYAQNHALEQRLNAALRESGNGSSSQSTRARELATIRKIVGARPKEA